MVRELSVFGRRTHGANDVARAATYASSAEVRSINLVKWFIHASSVAMFVRRSWDSVCCRTETRAASVPSAVGVWYIVLIIS